MVHYTYSSHNNNKRCAAKKCGLSTHHDNVTAVGCCPAAAFAAGTKDSLAPRATGGSTVHIPLIDRWGYVEQRDQRSFFTPTATGRASVSHEECKSGKARTSQSLRSNFHHHSRVSNAGGRKPVPVDCGIYHVPANVALHKCWQIFIDLMSLHWLLLFIWNFPSGWRPARTNDVAPPENGLHR